MGFGLCRILVLILNKFVGDTDQTEFDNRPQKASHMFGVSHLLNPITGTCDTPDRANLNRSDFSNGKNTGKICRNEKFQLKKKAHLCLNYLYFRYIWSANSIFLLKFTFFFYLLSRICHLCTRIDPNMAKFIHICVVYTLHLTHIENGQNCTLHELAIQDWLWVTLEHFMHSIFILMIHNACRTHWQPNACGANHKTELSNEQVFVCVCVWLYGSEVLWKCFWYFAGADAVNIFNRNK